MKKIKQVGDYSIFQKRSGRYAVTDKEKKLVHGEDKANILLAEGLIKRSEPKPAAPEEAPAAEAPAA